MSNLTIHCSAFEPDTMEVASQPDEQGDLCVDVDNSVHATLYLNKGTTVQLIKHLAKAYELNLKELV